MTVTIFTFPFEDGYAILTRILRIERSISLVQPPEIEPVTAQQPIALSLPTWLVLAWLWELGPFKNVELFM